MLQIEKLIQRYHIPIASRHPDGHKSISSSASLGDILKRPLEYNSLAASEGGVWLKTEQSKYGDIIRFLRKTSELGTTCTDITVIIILNRNGMASFAGQTSTLILEPLLKSF